MVKRLPSAQDVIPALWDRAPHQAPPLGACFFLSHSPCLCSLSRWLSLSLWNKYIESLKKLTRQEIKKKYSRKECLTLFVRMQAGTDTLENKMEVPQDVKHRAILRPTNCTTGYLPHRHRVMKRRGTCIPMFIAAMSIIAKLWKEPRCPSADEWTKMWFI